MSVRKLVVILGPTASGKSALGVRLAKKFNGVVISADSRQVYTGLDIGTAKITQREMRGIPHYLLDVASPKSQYSVARYARDVKQVLKKIPGPRPVFLVGGTPFYIQAVTETGAYSTVPPNSDLLRRLARLETATLLARLRKLNPARAKTIDPANRRRLIRAIEIAGAATKSSQPAFSGFTTLKIGLRLPRTILYRRIDSRVDRRLEKIIAEVRKLKRSGLSWKSLEALGLEYRWVAAYLRGQISETGTAQRIKFGSHDFARRQLTWWRRDKTIRWLSRPSNADQLVQNFLQA